MRTVHFPSSGGRPALEGGGVCPTRFEADPLDADLSLDADPQKCRTPWRQTPPSQMLVVWPVMHAGKPTPSPVNRMTETCKSITLSQTSFASGNYAQQFLHPFKSTVSRGIACRDGSFLKCIIISSSLDGPRRGTHLWEALILYFTLILLWISPCSFLSMRTLSSGAPVLFVDSLLWIYDSWSSLSKVNSTLALIPALI